MSMTVPERDIKERLRSAARIDPERLPGLKVIATKLAETASVELGRSFASPVAVTFAGLSSFTFASDMPELASCPLALLVRSSKFREVGYLSSDARLPAVVVEAVFGGDGRSIPANDRKMTAIDKFFTDRALRTFVGIAEAAFSEIAPLGLIADKSLSDAIGEKIDDLLPDEARSFVEFHFTVSIGRSESVLQMALPEAIVASHRRKLQVVKDEHPPIVDENWARDLKEGFQQTDLHVRALLSEQTVTLGELSCFHVGQTLTLDATLDSLIVLECEGQRLFRGHMGRSREAYVVRIEDVVDPTEEFIDDILAR